MVIGLVLVELFLGFLLASLRNATQPRPSSGGRLISITFATVSYGQRLSGPRSAFVARLRDLQGDFRYIERLDLPAADRDKILHHNVQALFGFAL